MSKFELPNYPPRDKAAERRVRNMAITAISIMVLAMAALIAFEVGFKHGVAKASAKATTIAVCHSKDALEGVSWEVDLTIPLSAQNCQLDDQAPFSLLCSRDLMARCEIPESFASGVGTD